MTHQVSKLTTISRRDLTPGQQAVQASHAALDFTFSHPREAAEWHKHSNYLINLSVADEAHLESLSANLRLAGIKVTEFREPDLDDQLTAIAFLSDEKTKKFTSGLPLSLKIKKI